MLNPNKQTNLHLIKRHSGHKRHSITEEDVKICLIKF